MLIDGTRHGCFLLWGTSYSICFWCILANGMVTFREGKAGGYKEFDEAEIEETRRRRKELEEV